MILDNRAASDIALVRRDHSREPVQNAGPGIRVDQKAVIRRRLR